MDWVVIGTLLGITVVWAIVWAVVLNRVKAVRAGVARVFLVDALPALRLTALMAVLCTLYFGVLFGGTWALMRFAFKRHSGDRGEGLWASLGIAAALTTVVFFSTVVHDYKVFVKPKDSADEATAPQLGADTAQYVCNVFLIVATFSTWVALLITSLVYTSS